MAKPINRLSERRGLGSLTLQGESIQEENTLPNEKKHNLKKKSCLGGSRKNFLIISEDDASHFRSNRLQDGAETSIVTVEELSRDCPPAGISPASSPSSKYRASLPGCSPRYPHNYHHRTIFSFPSLPSSSVSSLPSYQRRRLFYPFSTVGLLACNRYSASHRLSTVFEKPVGDASIHLAYPIQDCALHDDHNKVLQKLPLDRESLPEQERRNTSFRVLESQSLPILSHAWPLAIPFVNQFEYNSKVQSSPETHSSTKVCHENLPSTLPTVFTSYETIQQKQSGGEKKFNIYRDPYTECSSPCVNVLPSQRNHQQSAYRVDNNRTTDDFCTNRGGVVSLNSNRGFQSKKSFLLASCDCKTHSLPSTVIQKKNSLHFSRPLTESVSDGLICLNTVVQRPQPEKLTSLRTMDRRSHSHSAPAPSLQGTLPMSLGSCATCTSIDGQGVATSQSPSQALSGPIFTTQHYVSCKNHEIACRTCSCEKGQEKSASDIDFPMQTKSQCTSTMTPMTPITTVHTQLPDVKCAQCVAESNKELTTNTQVTAFSEFSCEKSPDIFPLPNRPARSRSPNAVACNSHCVFTELVRDRRACSADRPLCIHYSTAVDSTAKSNDSNFDKIISSSKNVCSTKVEKLRQLTQRLRPSLMPFQSASSASDQMQYSSPVPNSLPPIPIAPPRHPRIRAERKKTSKAKKDSATSTSDLTLPTKLASGATLFDTMTTSVLTSGNCDLNVNVEAATGDDNAALSKLKQHAEESTNKLTDKRELKNDIPHFLNDSTCINLQTSNDNQPPSNSDDFFDEVHLSLSKLNPRIMVGTYQQRTIPFRSASFSQIDVGSDGTYNRRPRTSITLKPVTYSIGKEMTGNSSPLHSASLPRRLKISDCNSEEASNPTANPSELEGNSGISTASKLASSEGQMDSNYNTFEELGDNEETVTAEYKTCIVSDKEMQDTFNQGQLQRTEHAFQSYPTPHQTDSNASTEFVIDHINNLESNSREISNDIETEVSPNCSSLGHSANVTEDEELKLDKTKEESILATYETNEISVSADIRLSPLQNSRKFTESNATISITDPDISANSRPLPVLDLLELNNHLLRLRAATRDGTLDHLADMEVAAQFGESVSLFPPSIDTTCSTTSTKDALKQLSSEESESRPWLNELLRHASFKEDDSALDSSYENYTAGSSERYNSEHATAYFNATSDITGKFESIYELKDCLKPLTLQSASSTTTLITLPESHCPAPNISDILQSSRNRRRSSKRRRHASWVFSDNSTEQNVLFKNSNRGRSLTFPPACLTISISDLYNTEKDLVMKRKDQVSQWYEESGFKVGKPSSFTRNEIQRAANEHHINKSLTKERVSPNTFPALFEPLYKDTQQSDTCLQTQCSLPAKNQSDHPQACQVSKECVLGKSPSTRLTITSALDEHLVSNNHTNQLPDIGLLVDDKQYISIEPDQSNRCTFRENLVQPHLERENTESNRELTESNIDVNNSSAIVSDEGNRISKAHHRLTVSLSVTLAPELECSDSSSYHNVSLSPYCPDLDSGNFNVSPEKMQKSPANPRRYGLKRRPLRGPYGEMLEAEMNKSEFNKMYAKRSDDLSFLREINPRINRDAKSSSPRPISPQTLNSVHLPTCDSTLPNWASITAVRQISAPLPTSHSMDDSQLKIGYNSSAMPAENSNPLHNPRLALSKRKNSANIPCEQSDNDFKVNDIVTKTDVVSLLPSPTLDDPVKSQILPLVVENTHVINSIPSSSHHRTSSSPCQFVLNEGGFTSEDEPELLELTSLSSLSRSTAHLLNSESPNIDTLRLTRIGSTKRSRDTRTHAIGELYDTERSYVESLQILVTKYLQPLKGPEYSGLVESSLVDEIFFQIPAILAHHEFFLEELRKRLEAWDCRQCVGGVFLDTLTKPSVIETYTAYINHWMHAKEAIKSACSAKLAFSKFLETTAREHKGKLALDSLLIMPVQRIPRYELLIKMLLKHTPREHPDHALLMEAQKEVHELAVKINCVEREAYGAEQQQATLRELESLVEGLGPGNLAIPERAFIRHDCVTIPSALGTRKERGFFLFSDLLVITSVKRRNTAMRKSSSYSTAGIASSLEANKFKLLMRVSLDDLEITKSKEENSKRSTRDLEHLEEDLITLNQIIELVSSLHVSHINLDEAIRDVQQGIQRQLNDKQSTSLDSQLATLDLAISTQDGIETLSVAFSNSEKRASWEESFNETKLRLRAMSPERRMPPDFIMPLPIRKTRAGLQFTCAAPTVTWSAQHLNDVWVCNSDGYVGQVCILSLHPEPNVTSCNGVCNARITCIAAIPASPTTSNELTNINSRCIFKSDLKFDSTPLSVKMNSSEFPASSPSLCSNFELESGSSSESSGSEGSAEDEPDNFRRYRSDSIPLDINVPSVSEEVDTTNQATMWLGTEDGCIHIYPCGENIRLKKNRTRIQQGAAVLCIVHVDNCVFASLANGDVMIYRRMPNGMWSTSEPHCVTVGSIIGPVTRMLSVNNALWCTSQNTVKILNTSTLLLEDQFAVSSDSLRSVLSLTSSGMGVWVAMQNSAVIRLFHALTHECVCDVNLAPAVNKMLSGCDDIIRQHKAACLRVTSMLACRDLLWVGTSAGVILTIPTPHLTSTSSRLSSPPLVTGLTHGHTGHVRFLTCVEATRDAHSLRSSRLHHAVHHGHSIKSKDTLAAVISSASNVSNNGTRLLVISGGDGYEDFRHSGISDSVGREDSTNHLLLWQV